eukprot:jgi/Tetstr1/432548/TSEL_021920.t2
MATDAVGQLSGAHRRNLAACPSLAIESGVRRVHATLDPAGAAPCRAEERRVEECEALERQISPVKMTAYNNARRMPGFPVDYELGQDIAELPEKRGKQLLQRAQNLVPQLLGYDAEGKLMQIMASLGHR